MAEDHDALDKYDPYLGMEKLNSIINNPDDTLLLCDMEWQTQFHREAGLSALFRFAMVKGGALEQSWRPGTTWERLTVDDYPTGFFPNDAFQHLMSHVVNLDDQLLLHKYLHENMAAKCPEPTLWAIWDFAAAKAEESNKQWLDDRQQRESTEKTLPAGKRLWKKLHGRFLASNH